VPDGPRAPGRGPVRRGHRGDQPGGGPGSSRRVAAPPGQQRAGPLGELRRRATRGAGGVPAGAQLLADSRLPGPGRAGRAPAGYRHRRGGPGPRPGPQRARCAFPVRQGEPRARQPGRGARASGACSRAGSRAQRRDERAGPDQAAAKRPDRRDPALPVRGPLHTGRADLRQEHRRGHPAHGVPDDLRVHADRADPDLGSRGHPREPAAVRDRPGLTGRHHRRGLLLDGAAPATCGPPGGTPDPAHAPGGGGARTGRGRGGGGVLHYRVHARA
jgi:hypothetical protein